MLCQQAGGLQLKVGPPWGAGWAGHFFYLGQRLAGVGHVESPAVSTGCSIVCACGAPLIMVP